MSKYTRDAEPLPYDPEDPAVADEWSDEDYVDRRRRGAKGRHREHVDRWVLDATDWDDDRDRGTKR